MVEVKFFDNPTCATTSSNQESLEYQVFCLLLTGTLIPLLLFNENLHNLYRPLALLVDASLVLQVLCCVLYFMWYPYSENSGNCAEALLSRFVTATIMFAEFHQVYFISNMLGLGKHNFRCGPLRNVLKVLIILNVSSSLSAFFIFPSYLLIVENLWTIIASSIQIYCIRLARALPWSSRDDGGAALSANDSAVLVFEKMSILQLVPSLFCILFRLNEVFSTSFSPQLLGLESVLLSVDVVCNFIFYMKTLLIKENANVKVEVIDV